ncbi:MAG: c-type cytochrome biogenesis protein CcmI [Alphaproteobacteria bacterium]|nr:c-type cytochrome biogenesis protein CcmI [Alphaproteobacteria bacterium]
MIWLVFALLVSGVLAALLYPLLKPGPAPTAADFDAVVYRSQLAEVEQDVERGYISPDLADAARTEIQRRLLSADRQIAAPSSNRRARIVAAATITVVVPLGTWLLYSAHGDPGLPGQPYAYRLKHDPAVMAAVATAKLAVELRAQPSGIGYMQLGAMYAAARDYAGAADAFEHAVSLGQENSTAWSDLGEAIVLANGGAVVPQALKAFVHSLSLDHLEPRARFYIGLAQAQIGNDRQAVAIWRDLERDSLMNAPWLPLLEREIGAAAARGKFDPRSVPPVAPDLNALNAAIARMPAAQPSQ